MAPERLRQLLPGAAAGRFPRLDDRDDLWRLLVTITARKATDYVRSESRQRRGGGRVVGEAALDAAARRGAAAGWTRSSAGSRPPSSPPRWPTSAAACSTACGDDELRTIALLRMEGYSNEEIAERLGCGLRTVERKLDADPQAVDRGGVAMSAATPPAPDSVPATVADRIDRVCDRFEAAWKAGRRPRIEEYLGEAAGPERRPCCASCSLSSWSSADAAASARRRRSTGPGSRRMPP